jgi:hypothetical protein
MRNKLKKLWILIFTIPVWAGIVFSQTSPPPSGAPSWAEHLDLAQVLIAGLFALVSYLLIRTLNKIDRNQGLMFDWLRSLEKQFNELKGEHNAIKEYHGGRRRGEEDHRED